MITRADQSVAFSPQVNEARSLYEEHVASVDLLQSLRELLERT
jgi:hypothetical protein